MRLFRLFSVVFALGIAGLLTAATIAQIGTDEMAQKSTTIVRGKVLSHRGLFRGDMIFTLFRVQVTEVWKGSAGKEIEVAVPGGVAQGYRQVVAGAPTLETGSDYVFFLWTGRSGLHQLIGLSQGALTIRATAQGEMAMRAASEEQMVDRSTGKLVDDRGVSMPLNELRRIVRRATEARSEVQ
jgi:hypothetical protein